MTTIFDIFKYLLLEQILSNVELFYNIFKPNTQKQTYYQPFFIKNQNI